MMPLDPRTRTAPEDRFAYEIKALWKAIRDVGSPSGTQRFTSVAKLQKAIDELAVQQAELADLVEAMEDRMDLYFATSAPALIAAEVEAQLDARFALIPATDLTATSDRFVVWSGPDGTLGHT